MELSEKIILIIGGATGIGRASAELCASRGAIVIIADLIDAQGWKGPFISVNVTDEASVKAMCSRVNQEYGRLDAVVQTAGILKGAYVPLEELDVAVFRQVIDVNVTGSFLCAKHTLPLLRLSPAGVLVLFTSGAGTGGSSSLAYGTSKAGVNGFYITLANRLAAEKVRLNMVSPGNIDTEMKRSVIASEAERKGTDMASLVAGSNLGDPEGVARVVAFLVSNEAEYVRGTITTR